MNVQLQHRRSDARGNLCNVRYVELRYHDNMSDLLLFKASKTKPKAISLTNRRLDRVPALISKIHTLQSVSFKNNALTGLCDEIGDLKQVCLLMRNTSYPEFPTSSIFQIINMNLYFRVKRKQNNKIFSWQLKSLNLGNNKLSCVPVQLSLLPKLETLHLFGNQISQLKPAVVGKLTCVINMSVQVS